jgi:ADP-dependent phosphofructokinase/glucokinase
VNNFIRKSIAKYIRPAKVHDVTELAENKEITSEIEKALWELKGSLGLDHEEIAKAVSSLRPSSSKSSFDN